jgi:hypothetical protein
MIDDELQGQPYGWPLRGGLNFHHHDQIAASGFVMMQRNESPIKYMVVQLLSIAI